jgi:hypothetical protein
MNRKPEPVREALDAQVAEAGAAWLADAEQQVVADPAALPVLFPQVGRRVGRGELRDPRLAGWTVDDAARAVLLVAAGEAAGAQITGLYRHGDANERRGVLRALDVVELDAQGRAAGAELVGDALRTNDLRLVAAALGPFGVGTLDDEGLSHAVLKCVFTGVPLRAVHGLRERATPGMARMLAGYVHERIAAGRAVPAEVWPLIDAHPPQAELDAITAELDSPVPERRKAAEAALADRAESKER